MNLKELGIGIGLIVLLGIGGLLYRNTLERSPLPRVCTEEAQLCPDGSSVGRTGPDCAFAACPSSNSNTFTTDGFSFTIPTGYTANPASDDPTLIAAFANVDSSQEITIRRYTLFASTTATDFIRGNAISDPSEMPAPATAFSSATIGSNRFSIVTLGRFEGVVDTAYYLVRAKEILRFDAISRNVNDWTNPSLDVSKLPANQDLRTVFGTFQEI